MSCRFSTMVTLVPSAANIDAYSTPITPAPTTTIDAGIDWRSRMPSESSTRCSSNSTPSGRAGLVPVAMTMYSPLTVVRSPRERSSTRRVCSSRNRPSAGDQIDPVAHQLVAHRFGLFADDVAGSRQQVGRCDLVLDPIARAVELALVHPGQVQNRLAQRLRRDGAGIDADAAEHRPLLDDRDRFAQLGRRDRGLLAARARADDDHVVFEYRTHELTSTPVRCGRASKTATCT